MFLIPVLSFGHNRCCHMYAVSVYVKHSHTRAAILRLTLYIDRPPKILNIQVLPPWTVFLNATLHTSTVNSSLVDTNGTYHFVQYSEVSLSRVPYMCMYIETN